MNAKKLAATTDSEGRLCVDISIALPNRQIEVLVVWQEASPIASPLEESQAVRQGWPPGWREHTAGALADDETFVRPQQPAVEEVEPLP